MAGYVIGSDKGKQIASSLKVGATYSASDGSTWKKNSDGSVSVTTKAGGYTANALQGGGTTTPSSGSSNTTSSSGNKTTSTPTYSGTTNTSGSTVKTSNTNQNNNITTNTSYNGNYLTIDPNTDYMALITSAVNSGDLSSAAKYEALRNAKLNYLGRGNEATNDYVNVYSDKSGNAYSNNQNGVVYTGNVGFNDNFSTATIGGLNYKKDEAGNLYINSGRTNGVDNYSLVGNAYNDATNEFMFTNPEDAKKAYVQQMIGTNNADVGSTYDYLANQGRVDNNYLNALMSGTTGAYTEGVRASVKNSAEDEQRQKLMAVENASFEDDTEAPYVEIPVEIQQVLDDNTWETDYEDASNLYNSRRHRSNRVKLY